MPIVRLRYAMPPKGQWASGPSSAGGSKSDQKKSSDEKASDEKKDESTKVEDSTQDTVVDTQSQQLQQEQEKQQQLQQQQQQQQPGDASASAAGAAATQTATGAATTGAAEAAAGTADVEMRASKSPERRALFQSAGKERKGRGDFIQGAQALEDYEKMREQLEEYTDEEIQQQETMLRKKLEQMELVRKNKGASASEAESDQTKKSVASRQEITIGVRTYNDPQRAEDLKLRIAAAKAKKAGLADQTHCTPVKRTLREDFHAHEIFQLEKTTIKQGLSEMGELFDDEDVVAIEQKEKAKYTEEFEKTNETHEPRGQIARS